MYHRRRRHLLQCGHCTGCSSGDGTYATNGASAYEVGTIATVWPTVHTETAHRSSTLAGRPSGAQPE